MKQSEDDDDEDHNDEDDVVEAGDCGRCYVLDCLVGFKSFCARHQSHVTIAIIVILNLLYFAYFCWSLYYAFGDEGSIRLLWVTCLVVICLALSLLFRCLRPKFESTSASRPINFIRQNYILINWFVAIFKHADIITCYARYDVCFGFLM